MRKNEIVFSAFLCLLCMSSSAVLAQKKEALKAIDPSQAVYDTPPPAPPSPTSNQANSNPFGSGIQGQPLGKGPQPSNYYMPDNTPPPSYAPPGAPTQAGQGWSPSAPGGDNRAYDQRIQRLEQIAFGSPYPEHELDDRLDHLENEVFSKKNTGMPPDQRLARLESKLLGQTAFGQTATAPPPSPMAGQPGAGPRPYGAPPAQMPMTAWANQAPGFPNQSKPGYYPVTQPVMPGQMNPQFPARPPQSFGSTMPPQQSYGGGMLAQQPMGSGMPPQQSFGSAMPSQQSFGNGMPPQQSFGNGMPPQQPYGSGMAPQQFYRPGTPPQQPMGAGMPPQQSFGYGMPPQQPMGSGMPPQQSFGSGMPPQQPMGSGMPPQQSFGSGMPPQQPMGSGMPPQQSFGSGMPPQQPMGSGMPPQQSFGSGMPPQQPMGSAMPPQQSFGSGMPPQQPMGSGMPPQQPFGSSMPPQQPMGSGMPPQQPFGSSMPPQQMMGSGMPPQQSFGSSMPAQAPQNQQFGTSANSTPGTAAPQTELSAGSSQSAIAPGSAAGSNGIGVANTLGLSRADRANANIENVIRSIPQKAGVGDYFAGINKYNNGAVARWTSFPVLVHLPQGSPSNWQKTLEESVSSWGKYIPVRVASPSEAADIEIAWINHLPPRTFGQTNLEVFNGHMRVTVYLLRPTYYLPNTPERMLHKAAEHEVGHALGIFGHSLDSSDLMYQFDSANAVNSTKDSGISPRDLNTLKRIYESPSLPPGFQSPHPMGWSLQEESGD